MIESKPPSALSVAAVAVHHALDHGSVVSKPGGCHSGNLPSIVQESDPDDFARVRSLLEDGDLLGRHGTALQPQGMDGSFRQLLEIVLVRRAQIALGRDVEAHAVGDDAGEEA